MPTPPAATMIVTVLGLATAALGGSPNLSDQTNNAGVAVSHDTAGFSTQQYSGGATIGDFNGDGWQDLFVLSGGGGNQRDHLFINNADGTFTDLALEWGLTAIHKGKSACVGDYDGDGDFDLYVTCAGPWGQSALVGHYKLYRNNGDETFTDVAADAGVATANPGYPDAWTSCFGDYDLDGDLDLYVGGFSGSPSNNGSHLFRNDGDGTFTDVTTEIGLFNGVGPIANLSSRFIDMDGDHYPELLLVGDFKGSGFVGSRYFRNEGDGTFSDLTGSSNTGDEENGMGHTVGDFDNNGMMDWYATSIYLPNIGWTGNKLYSNMGNHVYDERASAANCDDGGYGWGAIAVDVDHDGLLDIGETNGDSGSSGTFSNEQSYLWMNNGNGTFTERAIQAGLIHNGKGRSMLHFDYDNDGDQDIVISANEEPLRLYRNDLEGAGTNWLRVFLDTSGVEGLAPNGYGAKVRAIVGDVTMTRSIDGGTTFLGICELSAHFGLDEAETVDELIVEWPDGTETVLADVTANQTLTVAAGDIPCAADLDGSGAVDGADLGLLLGAWGAGEGDADLNGDGAVDGADLGLLLGAWGDCA